MDRETVAVTLHWDIVFHHADINSEVSANHTMDITINLDCLTDAEVTLRVKSTDDTGDQPTVLVVIDPGTADEITQSAAVSAHDLIKAIMLATGLTKDELE